MARKPEENEEEFEEEEKSHLQRKMERLDRQIDRLYSEMEKEDPGSPRYTVLARNIEELTRTQENLESAETERCQRAESEARMRDAKDDRKLKIAQVCGTVAGSFLGPVAVEMIRQRGDMRKVDKITQYEDDGNIVGTKAIKFVK